jgi:hypothetical protein
VNVILCGTGHNLRKILARLKTPLRVLMDEVRRAVSALIAFLEPRPILGPSLYSPDLAGGVSQGRLHLNQIFYAET